MKHFTFIIVLLYASFNAATGTLHCSADRETVENALDCIEIYANQDRCIWENWSEIYDTCQLNAALSTYQIIIVNDAIFDDECRTPVFTKYVRYPVYRESNLCHNSTWFTFAPTSSATPTESPTGYDACGIAEADLAQVFTDWRQLLLGLFIAAILTAPAASIYLRNTTEPPLKSYFYSCIVKYVASFFSASVLAGGLYERYGRNCNYINLNADAISFTAAFITEGIEFIFDVGRLVVFFGDPGVLDFYHNARWNSDVGKGDTIQGAINCCAIGLSSIPIAFFMFFMWIFNFIAQMNSFFYVPEGEETFFQSFFVPGKGGMILMATVTFVLLGFTCVGGYYLLRLICPCFNRQGNQGEDQGIGFYWAQFKVIAIDVPSLMATALISPSSLVFFWTAEFINDIFPTVAGYFVEKLLLEEKDDEKGDNHEFFEEDYQSEREKDVEAYDLENAHKWDSISIDLERVQSSGKQTYTNFKIGKDFPSQLEGCMTKTTWEEFCDDINHQLQTEVSLKTSKSDTCLKSFCIVLGIVMSLVYWFLWYRSYDLFEDDRIRPGPYFAIAVIFCFIGGILCVKLCFVRDMESELEILFNLEKICEKFSIQQGEGVRFYLKTEYNVCNWIRHGGLSCEKGINSVEGIECIFPTSDKKTEQEELDDNLTVSPAKKL